MSLLAEIDRGELSPLPENIDSGALAIGSEDPLSKRTVIVVFSPFFKFFKDYIFKLGFLDGYYGYVVCRISAHATFLKYIKLKELNDKAKGKKENC